jgi:hypothetical protein
MWRIYSRLPRRSRRQGTQQFQRLDTTWLLPTDASPASVIRCNNTQWIQVSGLVTVTPSSTPVAVVPTTLQGTLSQRKLADQWAVASCDCSDEGKDLADAIRNGTATAVSNGSYQSGIGISYYEGATPQSVLWASTQFPVKRRHKVPIGVN